MTDLPPHGPKAIVIHGDFPAGGPIPFSDDRHYLLYARGGLLKLEAEGRRWSLPPARAALIAAGQPVTFWLPGPVTALSVLFDTGWTTAPDDPLAVFDLSPLARALLDELRSCTEGPRDDHDLRLFETLYHTILRLARAPSPASRPTGESDLVRHALDRTEATLAEAPTFANLAQHLNVTERTLARRIHAETGMTWSANLRLMRILCAIEGLVTTRDSVTDIAFATGYTSLSAFNAAFRDLVGLTPTEYRDSLRN
ncbi:helix-turn-helix domain-containing protein [Pseudooceanicola sp.]|uniref:helix-turn-helix domain-containing protein n=1 Tax=Pseudooceanicola sp. TaxID=1914328 RepID=UPI0035C6D6B0